MGVGFFLAGTVGQDSSPQLFGHGGSDEGFKAEVMAEIDGSGSAAAMVHSLGGGLAVRAGTSAVGQALGWPEAGKPDLDEPGLMAALGEYSTDDGRTFELAITEDVTLTAPGQPPLPLDMVSILSWTSPVGLTVTLEVEDGSVEGISLHQAGTTTKASRST